MAAKHQSRRNFITMAALAGVGASIPGEASLFAAEKRMSVKQDHLSFLFQGDSITDGNRGRTKDPNHILGHGYAFSIASRAGAAFPEKGNSFYNRGISGNKVTDLAARWQADTLDLNPDVLSILIGVNDAGSVIRQKDMVTIEKYEETYRSLLDQTRAKLPDCLLVLCEPFILSVGKIKENWNEWDAELQRRQEVVNRLAKEYKAVFVPLQNVFTNACNRASADYWIWDGIHPTYSGHELITREWLKQVGKEIPFLHKV